ncbi:MAG: type II secretion system F family protein [Pseudomonadota bacterium]
MRTFQYTAQSANGAIQQGDIVATDKQTAAQQLLADKLTPLSIKPSKTGASLFQSSSTALKGKRFEQFASRLAALLGAGVPLADALSLMAKSDARVGGHAQRTLDSIRKGDTLGAHLASIKQGPSPELIALVRVGEETGTLADQLQLVAETLSRKAAFRKELTTQLIYPLCLCVLIILTLFFLG